MSFRKLRLAPIISYVSTDGYPIYGAFKKLQDVSASEELNAVEFTFSNVVKEKTYQADDKEVIKKVIVRGEGKLKVYGCDKAQALDMFGFSRDINNNTLEVMNGYKKSHYGLFFESKDSHDKRFQKYIYDVEFDEPEFTAATDTGEEVGTLEIPFIAYFLTIDGHDLRGAVVYEGNPGWVANEPVIIYKQAPATALYLSAPIISLSNERVVTWSAVPNATGYIVYVNGMAQTTQAETSFAKITTEGTYSIVVCAKGDGINYYDSTASNEVSYTV
jgi:hypothetical protein